MKRLTSALLALLLSLMLLPTAVMAAEPAQQGNSDSITYINPLYEGVVTEDDHLTWEEARALDVQDGLAAAARSSDANATTNAGTYTSMAQIAEALRYQMVRRTRTVEFSCKTSVTNPYDNSLPRKMMIQAVAHGKGGSEAPRSGDSLLYQYGKFDCSWEWAKGVVTYRFVIYYYTTAAQETALNRTVTALKSSLGLNNAGKTDYQKISAIHDWIKNNVSYEMTDSTQWTAYGAAVLGKAVCQGYSVLFYRLALEAGIDTYVIAGQGGGEAHSWNIVQLGSKYYLVDCTWDENLNTNRYFLRGSNWFYSAEGGHTAGTSPENYTPRSYDYNAAPFTTIVSKTDYRTASAVSSVSLRTNAATGKPVISWSAVSGAAQYEVYRSTNGTAYSIIRRTTGLSYTDTTAAAGTTYYYKVRANDSTGVYGDCCAAKSIRTAAPLAVPSVTLTTNGATGKPVVSWGAVTGAAQYEVYRSATGSSGSYKIVRRTTGLSYTDTAASAGSTYYYAVRVVTGSGDVGSFSAAKSIRCGSPLAVPSVTLRTNAATGKPVVSWKAVSGASRYEVYRSTTGTANSYQYLTRTTGVTYTDTAATAGSTYYYVVRVVAGSGDRGAFSAARAIRCGGALASPSATVRTNAATGKPVVSWSKVSGAAQYEVYRAVSGGSYSIVRRTTTLSFTDTTAMAGTTYYYKVRVLTANGDAGYFGAARGIRCASALAVPAMWLQNDTATGKPVISWGKVTGASKYEIYRSATGAAGSYKIIRSTAALNYTDTTAAAGSTYYYAMRVVAANGDVGGFCAAKSIRCGYPQVKLATPTTTLSTNNSGRPVISWTRVTNADSYEVWRSDGVGYQLIRTTTALTYTDTTARTGTTYYYMVRAAKGESRSAYSSAKSVKAGVVGLDTPIVTVICDFASGQPKLNWRAVAGATQYEVYRSATGANNSYKIVRRTSGLSFTDTTATPGTTYYYRVRAMKGSGAGAAYGSFSMAKEIKCGLAFPSVSVKYVNGHSVISWSKVNGATQYEVWRSPDGEKAMQLIRRTAGLTYTDTAVKAGACYYTVRAINGTQCSNYAPIVR